MKNQNSLRFTGLLLGPFLFLLSLVLPAPFTGMSDSAWLAAGLAALMATWWITEAVPIPVTSLLPVVLAPIIGLTSLKLTTSSYSHPLIFLFLGGFILSLAMERWQLHKRIALIAMTAVGDKPERQIGGLMLITAFLSMWMSNTATAVMMLPIALSVIEMNKPVNTKCGQQQATSEPFAVALLLGIAYSASIGGVATLIGTPPNALMAAYLSDSYGIELGFAHWMLMALPLAIVMLIICWFWLTRLGFKVNEQGTGSGGDLKKQLFDLGAWQKPEIAVAIVFICTAVSWMLRPLLAHWTGLAISDTGIAMTAAISLFLIPVDWTKKVMVMDWHTAQKLPWGVLILFGGGLSLAAQIKHSGLADYIASSLASTATLPLIVVIVIVTSAIVFLTEITSNTATAAGFLPLLGPVAVSITGSPLLLVVPAALAASCAFMMPVATPPNSIVFASGQLQIKQMVKAGLFLNLVAIVLISLLAYLLFA